MPLQSKQLPKLCLHCKKWTSSTVWKFYFQNISRIFPHHLHTMNWTNYGNWISYPVPHSRHRLVLADPSSQSTMDNIFLSHFYILIFPPQCLFSITLILICITLSLVTLSGNHFSFHLIALQLQEKCHFPTFFYNS